MVELHVVSKRTTTRSSTVGTQEDPENICRLSGLLQQKHENHV